MAISLDPENQEIEALFRYLSGFENQSVLEIGCGDGRLTWQIAPHARPVVGIDPREERIARAKANIPAGLAPSIHLYAQSLEEFAGSQPEGDRFDCALLSWSL